MATDYDSIREENKRRYGTDIGRIGPMLLANRYDDRSHFIYELLQNAEDALARRRRWTGSRTVSFELGRSELRVSHFGAPFSEGDVRGVCGIGQGTKDEFTAIGRFGIGFKSVYAVTDRPEIHSGDEDFAIENFVWPRAVCAVEREPGETVILLPFREGDSTCREEIARGLSRLGASTLLFLRQINQVRWRTAGGSSGVYRREASQVAPGVRRVTVSGQRDEEGSEEKWLVFSRRVRTGSGRPAGHVEIAFFLSPAEAGGPGGVEPVSRSPLVAYFPTAVETHLGFLVQGPYRTTPSRDNVAREDPWNRYLVSETGSLLIDALGWLRDEGMLDVDALRCLPTDREKFQHPHMFAALFETVKQALSTEPLLPAWDGGHLSARRALLGRGEELCRLLGPAQLSNLLGLEEEPGWLAGQIGGSRAGNLREYVVEELGVREVTPETVVGRLDARFLEGQPDEWILRLYEFLAHRPSLRNRLRRVPLIRLEDGRHILAHENGGPAAYLPGRGVSGFPTVRRAVCGSEDARRFLESLGLAEPDPVDDVLVNVLGRYRQDEVAVDEKVYEADIGRILDAFDTDSMGQRDRLVAELSESRFVRAVDRGSGCRRFVKPGDTYLATERLKQLFDGVEGVLMVDDSCPGLQGGRARRLLEACGASGRLRPVEKNSLSRAEQARLRQQAGHEHTSGYSDRVKDWTLLGLEEFLHALPHLDVEDQRLRARLLWAELVELEARRKAVFTGEYRWTHYGSYRVEFDAAFVRKLNDTAWVPDQDGSLHRPEFVAFENLGWKENPFLQSKIRFKPPALEQLARQVGIELGVLEALKKEGITSEEMLRLRLGPGDATGPDIAENEVSTGGMERTSGPWYGRSLPRQAAPPGKPSAPGGDERTDPGASRGAASRRRAAGERGNTRGTAGAGRGGPARPAGGSGSRERSGGSGRASFVSYVAVSPENEEPDPDGLEREERLAIEEEAIRLVLEREPCLRRTAPTNPGFDLLEPGDDGVPVRWVEVKGMTADLSRRPVGLSRAQFEEARRRGERYWLYVVEQVGTPARTRVVRIQDPAGKARTFTFDHGWTSVAEID